MPITRPARSCAFDGRTFSPKRVDQKYCSRACQRAAVLRDYHLEKFRSGEDKRTRYNSRVIAEALSKAGLVRDSYLDAIAAVAEADEQVKLWTQRLSMRKQVANRMPGAVGVQIKGRLLKEGEPVGEPIERANGFGVACTDGLIAVVSFSRPV